MKTNTITNFEHEQDQLWATRLVECMKSMGARHTSAVLLSLNGSNSIKPYQRYPEKPHYFGDKHWHAFYHCHEAPAQPFDEHGHYHFFTRVNRDDEWSHVIAMGMDGFGQPLRLLTTNLWVTDGKWFDASKLQNQMNILTNSQEQDLATEWFKYLLLLYQYEINELLIARDNKVTNLFPKHQDQCYLDRSVYYLSEMDINLRQQLRDVFSPHLVS